MFTSLNSSLFKLINQKIFSPYIDWFFIFLSSDQLWWLVTAICIGICLGTRSLKYIQTLLLALFALGLADSTSTYILKPSFQKLRPCHKEPVRLVDQCGSLYGFPSNHAANSTAVSLVVFGVLGGSVGWIALLIALWVSYSRVYLGVHYPIDILFGFAWGSLCALFVITLLRKPIEKLLFAPCFLSRLRP